MELIQLGFKAFNSECLFNFSFIRFMEKLKNTYFKYLSQLLEYNFRKPCLDLEETIKRKALSTPGFPFQDIMNEFQRHIEIPEISTKWSMPKLNKLVVS